MGISQRKGAIQSQFMTQCLHLCLRGFGTQHGPGRVPAHQFERKIGEQRHQQHRDQQQKHPPQDITQCTGHAAQPSVDTSSTYSG